ncbi:MAG: hypothetical protein AAF938_08650 [Myxococcota bacterium]
MRSLAAAVVLLGASVASALMPPHVTTITPSAQGARLHEGRIVKFHGYSFAPDLESTVTDASGNAVRVEHYLWTGARCANGTSNCDESMPGAVQIYSVLSVKLPPPQAGVRLRIELMGSTAVVTTDDEGYRMESVQ